MHALFDLSGAFVVILLAGTGLLTFLRSQADWTQRRQMHILILALPLISLFTVIAGLHHVVASPCTQPEPVWDHVLDVLLLALLCIAFLGAGVLGLIKLLLMKH